MEKLTLIQNDPWLKPYSDAIEGRYHRVIEKEKTLTILISLLQHAMVDEQAPPTPSTANEICLPG